MQDPPRQNVILCVGHDQRVLETQKALLESAGWDVVVTTDDVEAILLVASRRADLVLLGDSIDLTERLFMCQTLKKMNASLMLVLLERDRGEIAHSAGADAILESLSAPSILLKTINNLLDDRARHQLAS